jgi:magnesium-transporting ATPase (P-type)
MTRFVRASADRGVNALARRRRDEEGEPVMSTDVQLPATAPVEETPTWHVLSREGVAEQLHVEPERGLTAAEADERLRRYGPNKFAEAKPEPRWRAFVRQYDDPMQIVLLVAGIISIYPVKQAGTGIVILLLTVLNAILGLNQEGKAAAAVAALAKLVAAVPEDRIRHEADQRPRGLVIHAGRTGGLVGKCTETDPRTTYRVQVQRTDQTCFC